MHPLQLSDKEIDAIHSRLKEQHIDLMQQSWLSVSSNTFIKTWLKHPQNGTISLVRAESEIPCSAQTLFDYLVTDIDQTCKEWNDLMLYSGVIKKYTEQVEISRIVSEGNIVADREDVFIRCTGQFENGNLYEVSKGFDTTFIPIDTSISKYTVRSEMHFASKEIVPIDENHCLYKTIWHYDPSGWLSKLIPKKLLAKMILKNLVHEHERLEEIFSN